MKTGYDFIAIGDWSAEQDEEVPQWMTLRGGLQRPDEAWQHTVRTTTTNVGNTVIDYALTKGSVRTGRRTQGQAHSPTHEFVCYEVGIGGRLRGKDGRQRSGWETRGLKPNKTGGRHTGRLECKNLERTATATAQRVRGVFGATLLRSVAEQTRTKATRTR